MQLTSLKLVTIVAEAVLQERILEDIRTLGAKGCTIMNSEGHGSRGRRTGEIPGQNIRIETLVSPSVADKIIE
ncbi:MAG: transcriptional regulator, partial [Proteobacteria bacterium]|nr:transcriptional regulator [Pseudomonadota bacterium]